MFDFQARREKLRRLIRKAGADGLLVTNFINVTYLSGFTGDDSYLLLRGDGEVLISDGRYSTQLEEECPGLDLEIRPPGTTMLEATAKVLQRSKLARLGIEADSMTVGLRDQIAGELPKLSMAPTSGLVETLRLMKDAEEVEEIRQAVWYAEKGFAVLRATLRPEKTEKQLADELEQQMRLFGAAGCSFPTIVAAGPRGALPHARATGSPIGGHAAVLIDWGASGRLYKSDLTRVLVTGKISPKLQRLYTLVLRAQEQAIAAIRPGVLTKDVDQVARQIIAEAGLARSFGHGLGHGVGLEIHEGPRLAANTAVVLKAGMVVTVEPGVYLPGWGGIRIEDDVLVTRTGHEVLTSVPKQWEETILG